MASADRVSMTMLQYSGSGGNESGRGGLTHV